jgi:glycerophosphoryl diester phosphodiesterase
VTDPVHPCLVIAHRGASGSRPENTLEAFRHARALGADWVELDVRRSADGALVVHHDAHLADGRAIVETRAADLPAAVPTLSAALDACAGMGVNVEIKNDPVEPDFDPAHDVAVAVAEATRAWLGPAGPAAGRVIVSSFAMETVDRLRATAPDLPTGWLTFDLQDPVAVVERTSAHGHAAIHPYDAFVDRGLVDRAHAAGLAVYVWTVDDPGRMTDLVGMGVDGIITNHPDRARAVVDRLRADRLSPRPGGG